MNSPEFVSKITNSAVEYPFQTFSQKGKIYTCVNPYSYHLVRRNYRLYLSMDGLFVDGMLMCWLIRILHGRKVPRLSFDMTAIASDLFKYLNDDNRESIYFIGAKQTEIEGTVYQIRQAYPKMNIAGFRNGYFKSEEERQITISAIVNSNPDFTVVGMGSPLQEKFALELKDAGYRGIVFTCGGFLHQTSAKIDYYPNWVNKLNLRAFYRLFHEKGLFKRLYNVLVEFPVLFTWDTIMAKIKRQR